MKWKREMKNKFIRDIIIVAIFLIINHLVIVNFWSNTSIFDSLGFIPEVFHYAFLTFFDLYIAFMFGMMGFLVCFIFYKIFRRYIE